MAAIPEGSASRRADLCEKVLSLVYEDAEHKADKLVLSVDNWDLANFGEQLVRSAVGQSLCTVGASDLTPGEVPWRHDFCSGGGDYRQPRASRRRERDCVAGGNGGLPHCDSQYEVGITVERLKQSGDFWLVRPPGSGGAA